MVYDLSINSYASLSRKRKNNVIHDNETSHDSKRVLSRIVKKVRTRKLSSCNASDVILGHSTSKQTESSTSFVSKKDLPTNSLDQTPNGKSDDGNESRCKGELNNKSYISRIEASESDEERCLKNTGAALNSCNKENVFDGTERDHGVMKDPQYVISGLSADVPRRGTMSPHPTDLRDRDSPVALDSCTKLTFAKVSTDFHHDNHAKSIQSAKNTALTLNCKSTTLDNATVIAQPSHNIPSLVPTLSIDLAHNQNKAGRSPRKNASRKNECIESSIQNNNSASKSSSSPSANEAQMWVCVSCTFHNLGMKKHRCEMCGQRRPPLPENSESRLDYRTPSKCPNSTRKSRNLSALSLKKVDDSLPCKKFTSITNNSKRLSEKSLKSTQQCSIPQQIDFISTQDKQHKNKLKSSPEEPIALGSHEGVLNSERSVSNSSEASISTLNEINLEVFIKNDFLTPQLVRNRDTGSEANLQKHQTVQSAAPERIQNFHDSENRTENPTQHNNSEHQCPGELQDVTELLSKTQSDIIRNVVAETMEVYVNQALEVQKSMLQSYMESILEEHRRATEEQQDLLRQMISVFEQLPQYNLSKHSSQCRQSSRSDDLRGVHIQKASPSTSSTPETNNLLSGHKSNTVTPSLVQLKYLLSPYHKKSPKISAMSNDVDFGSEQLNDTNIHIYVNPDGNDCLVGSTNEGKQILTELRPTRNSCLDTTQTQDPIWQPTPACTSALGISTTEIAGASLQPKCTLLLEEDAGGKTKCSTPDSTQTMNDLEVNQCMDTSVNLSCKEKTLNKLLSIPNLTDHERSTIDNTRHEQEDNSTLQYISNSPSLLHSQLVFTDTIRTNANDTVETQHSKDIQEDDERQKNNYNMNHLSLKTMSTIPSVSSTTSILEFCGKVNLKVPNDGKLVLVHDPSILSVEYSNRPGHFTDDKTITKKNGTKSYGTWISNRHARRFMVELDKTACSKITFPVPDVPGETKTDNLLERCKNKQITWQAAHSGLGVNANETSDKHKAWNFEQLFMESDEIASFACNQNKQYAFKETIRCKETRSVLPCYECSSCRRFYEVLHRTGHELTVSQQQYLLPQQLRSNTGTTSHTNTMPLQFGRHRSFHPPSETPVDFWELDFIDEIPNRQKKSS